MSKRLPASPERLHSLLNLLIRAVVTIKFILVSHLPFHSTLCNFLPRLSLSFSLFLSTKFMCLITLQRSIKKKDSTCVCVCGLEESCINNLSPLSFMCLPCRG